MSKEGSSGDIVSLYTVGAFFGISSLCIIPVSFNYGAELTFPTSPVSVNAFMAFSNHVTSVIVYSIQNAIVSTDVTEGNIESAVEI